MAGRHRRNGSVLRSLMPASKPSWQITVLSADGQRLIFHAPCEDRVEIRALASEARHQDQRLQIWIRDPYGRLTPWD